MKNQPSVSGFFRAGMLLVCCVLILVPFCVAHALTIELVTSFTYPGAGDTVPSGINDRGEVTGWFQQGITVRGFIRNFDGSFQPPLVEPNGDGRTTAPTGINNSGVVCGYFGGFNSSGHAAGFFFSGNSYTEFDIPGSFNGTWVNGLNDAGDFTGWYDANGGGSEYGFIDIGGTLTRFVVPESGSYGTTPLAINNAGEVVGNYYGRSGGNSYSFGFFRDAAGAITSRLSVLPNTDTTLSGLNDKDQIVGSYGNTLQKHGLLMDLSGHAITYDYPGATFTTLNAINNRGYICGWYHAGRTRGAFIARVVN